MGISGWRLKRHAMATVVASVLVVATGTSVQGSGDDGPSGTLRLGVFSDLVTLDPQLSSDALGMYPLIAYDTLLSIGADDQPQPWLATAWEQQSPTAWQFSLRDDVVFHDGSVFNAETVRVNFERAASLAESPNADIFQSIDQVEVVDATTVVLHLTEPRPSLPTDLATVAGAMISPEALADGLDLTRADAGSGGWIWDSSALREGSLHVYRANPDYWNPDAVRVENVELHVIADPTARLNAVETGQIDIAGTVQANQIDGARAAGLTAVLRNQYTQGLVIIDTEGTLVPALGDERVRQAIGFLIDREGINQAVYAGTGDPAPGGMFSAGSQWYCEPCDNLFGPSADVERATQLLADAGYADGFTMTVASNDTLRLVLSAVAQLLAEANITLEIVAVQSGSVGTSNRSGEFPVAFASRADLHPAPWYDFFISAEGPYNPLGSTLMSPVDAMVEEAATLTDPELAQAAWDDIQLAILEAGAYFPFGSSPTAIVVGDTVTSDVAPRPEFALPLPLFIEVG